MYNVSVLPIKEKQPRDDTTKSDELVAYCLPCPFCGRSTKTKAHRETVMLHFPLYCSRCKRETIVDVIQFRISLSKEPDA
ncbi:MAG: cysteine-rich KTR domain-containing protein [Succiniclasticum sp.]|nr:cysteine-rich KTR domain-containing protein [Succiniclasticum sp.]